MKKVIALSLVAVLLIGAFVYLRLPDQEVALVTENIDERTNQLTENETEPVVVDRVVINDGAPDFGVYVVASTGERIKIAESDDPETIEDYFSIVTYHKAYLSPNKQFVALEASLFEDLFVVVYDVASGTLHDRQWGQVGSWTEDNLLTIDSCNLAGEDCTYLISNRSEAPWEMTERPAN